MADLKTTLADRAPIKALGLSPERTAALCDALWVWKDDHVHYADDAKPFTDAINKAMETLPTAPTPPPAPTGEVKTRDQYAIEYVERTWCKPGQTFRDIMPPEKRLGLFDAAMKKLYADQATHAEQLVQQMVAKAERRQRTAEMTEQFAREQGIPVRPIYDDAQGTVSLRATAANGADYREALLDRLKLANATSPGPTTGSPLQRALSRLAKLDGAAKSGKLTGDMLDLARRQRNSVLMEIRSLSRSTYERIIGSAA